MRLIDADALERHVYTEWVNGELSNSEWVDFRQWLKDEPTVEPASPWHRVEEPPKPHKDVLVTGIEAINNHRVYKVMVNDNGTWRPTDYAPSIRWDYWMPIEPPKEDA